MGFDYHYYVGPVIVLKGAKTIETTREKVLSICQEGCLKNRKNRSSRFCSECGTEIADKKITVKDKVKMTLSDIANESSFSLNEWASIVIDDIRGFHTDAVIISNTNEYGYRIDSDQVELFDLSDLNAEEEIDDFWKENDAVLKLLAKYYASVSVKYLFVTIVN